MWFFFLFIVLFSGDDALPVGCGVPSFWLHLQNSCRILFCVLLMFEFSDEEVLHVIEDFGFIVG